MSNVDDFLYTALHFASVGTGAVDGLKECLKHKEKFNISAPEKEGNTALHFAAIGGSFEKVKALIDAGASINQKNNVGNTPILAAMYGPCENFIHIAYMIQKGADYLETNNSEMDCLSMAAYKNHIAVAKLLLNKINPTKSQDTVNTGIMRALGYAGTEEMKRLIREYIPAYVTVEFYPHP